MEWMQIRDEFLRQLQAAKIERGLTQTKIAAAAGLAGQSSISKIKTNENQGPAVEILVKAVEGLGLSVSEFFERIERRARGEEDFVQDPMRKGR